MITTVPSPSSTPTGEDETGATAERGVVASLEGFFDALLAVVDVDDYAWRAFEAGWTPARALRYAAPLQDRREVGRLRC
jgi:hypothetical protein